MKPDHTDPAWLQKAYHKDGMSLAAMGEACGVTDSAVQYQMQKHGIPREERGYRPNEPEPYRSADWLRQKHHEEKMSLYEMADECSCSMTCIHRWMERFGVEKRSKSEAAKLRAEQHPHSIPSGKDHHSWKPPEERQDFYHSGEWRRVRKAVYERDDHECRRCGASGDTELHAHHIEAVSKGGAKFEPGNLVTLCRECHMAEHND